MLMYTLSVFLSNNVNTYSILVVTLTSLHQNAATRRVSVESIYDKQLTLDILKFGITYWINGRNAQYMKDKRQWLHGFQLSLL
jgi:hypothetical protein